MIDNQNISWLAKGTSDEEATRQFHRNVLASWIEKINNNLPNGYEKRFKTAYDQAKLYLSSNDDLLIQSEQLCKKLKL